MTVGALMRSCLEYECVMISCTNLLLHHLTTIARLTSQNAVAARSWLLTGDDSRYRDTKKIWRTGVRSATSPFGKYCI